MLTTIPKAVSAQIGESDTSENVGEDLGEPGVALGARKASAAVETWIELVTGGNNFEDKG